MPSESVVGFLDHAQASRVLFPEQVEQLIRQPDIPQSDLNALCEYLLSRGVLTRFQAAAIREARGQELSFAGYPVIDDLGTCEGGTAYKALHPSLRTPLVLRRLRCSWLAPADNPADYVARVRAFGMLAHPNLVHLLDVGISGDEIFAIIEQPTDGADLETMATEIGGAMPGFLASEYCRAIAAAIRSMHERGGTHGEVRPSHLIVSPLTVKTSADGRQRRRPAPDAVVRLAEAGLVPLRPPAAHDPARVSPYMPPEQLDSDARTPRGDIYGLGATLYFLLTGRPPFTADAPDDLVRKIRTTDPAVLSALRPDLPTNLVNLVGKMLEKQPDRRPATMADVEAGLIEFCRAGTVPPQPVLGSTAPAAPVAYPVASAEPVEELPAEEPADAWGVGAAALAEAHASADRAPRRREMSASEKGKTRMLLVLGGLLHLTALALLIAWLTGVFDPSPVPETPDTHPTMKTDPPKKKPKDKNRPG
jgi:hypothetical protein